MEKKFFLSKLIATQLVALKCPDGKQETFHRQPMSQQAVPRFSMSIRETFFNSISLAVIDEYEQGAVIPILTVLGHVYHVVFRRVLWHLSYHVFRVLNFRNKEGARVIFFPKSSKFNLDYKNAWQNPEKGSCFSYNCISYSILKLSLLRTGYFSSVANVLTTNPTIWYVNKRDFFEHNLFARDQWIW